MKASPWLGPGLVVLAAAVVAAVIVVRPGGGLPGTEPGTGSGLATYSAQGLSFSYPAGWKNTELDLTLHYETVLAYMGSGSGTMTCGSDYIPGAGGTCDEQIRLGPDSVVLKVSLLEGPPTPHGTVAWALSGDPSATAVTVGGQPAARQSASPQGAADAATEWTIAKPGDSFGAYTIIAYLKGPDTAADQAQIQALIDSIALTP
ncbi:MAG: hypothetical protein ACRDGL_11005 [Candidatus Limnocylindrales bacterium]